MALIESTDDFIALATPDGRITYLNEGASRLVGLASVAEVLGKPIEPDALAAALERWL